MLARTTRRLVAAERPLLDAHGLSMWDYVVLSRLAHHPPGTQLALAQAINYDKTRLIALLDRLEADGLVVRERDPADRRARIVRLTDAGRTRHAAAQADIRTMEDALLERLSPSARDRFVAALIRLDDDGA